jgi:hypothetical protein
MHLGQPDRRIHQAGLNAAPTSSATKPSPMAPVFPGYGSAICRGFFDSYRDQTVALLILRAVRRLAEVPPPLVAAAEELGRQVGKAAASRVFDGNTPEGACQRVLRGISEGDPAILDAIEPVVIGPAAGYTESDLARDLGIEPRRPRPAPRRVGLRGRLHRQLLAGNRADRPRARRLEPGTCPAQGECIDGNGNPHQKK